MTNSSSEIAIKLDGFTLAGLQTNRGSRHRVLCLHGWLDNAASFAPLMQLIDDAEIIALDLPGHGHSEHQQTIYSLAAQAHTVLAVADKLNWQTFTLVGHSLGGCIAPFATAAAKDRIEKLILIEAAGPRSEPAESLPARLAQFHEDMSKPNKFQSRLFDSVDQAIDSRLRANKMTQDSARLIIERQLKKVSVGGDIKWQWRFDSKLRVTSPSYFTEAQVQAVIAAIECQTLCILADDGYLTDRAETNERLSKLKNLQIRTLKGNHHLHIDTPQPVADEINLFLQ